MFVHTLRSCFWTWGIILWAIAYDRLWYLCLVVGLVRGGGEGEERREGGVPCGKSWAAIRGPFCGGSTLVLYRRSVVFFSRLGRKSVDLYWNIISANPCLLHMCICEVECYHLLAYRSSVLLQQGILNEWYHMNPIQLWIVIILLWKP